MGGRCSWYIGVIADLNGCCYRVPGRSQAADLLCSGQCCYSFGHQDTHFSALSLGFLPVHTIISDGAWGFAGPLQHVAAAASEFSGHSGLLVASAAKETEYMRDSAAASVAAFVPDGQTDMLPAPAAKAFHYKECQSVKQTLQAAATAAAILVRSSFVAIVLHMSEWCWFVAGFWVGCILLWNSCQVHLEKTCLHFLARGRNKDAQPKGAKNLVHFSTSRL